MSEIAIFRQLPDAYFRTASSSVRYNSAHAIVSTSVRSKWSRLSTFSTSGLATCTASGHFDMGKRVHP
jgi:hypothetical protein